MSERWNNQTQDWETYDENGDVVEAKEEWVALETVELPPEELPSVELPPVETVVELPPEELPSVELPPVETVVELPPVVDTPEEFGNVELVEIPIEVVNAKSSHFGFEAWHGVLGIIVLVVAWRWLKK
jgi:hypothetical protein